MRLVPSIQNYNRTEGFGKREQGITTPLVVKKTDNRAGVIVNTSETKQENEIMVNVNFNGTPTQEF